MNLKKVQFYFVNGLTFSRIFLALIIAILIFLGARSLSFFLFLIAILTDILDGDLSRRFNVISNFGDVIDGVADLILIYSVVIPLFILNEFSLLLKIIIAIVTFLVLVIILKQTIKNKKFTLPRRKPSTTINSYFVYMNLALFIINSPYKYPMVYFTIFTIALTTFDYFHSSKKLEK